MNETKQAIKSAFTQLYKKQAYESMSVKGLCSQVPVARTTFYQYYDNLGMLKAEIEDELIADLLALAEKNAAENIESINVALFFEQTLMYIREQWDINYAFLISHPNYSYISKWKAAIKYHFRLRFPSKVHNPSYPLVLEVIASAVIGAYTYWLEHPDEVNIKELSSISAKMLNTIENII